MTHIVEINDAAELAGYRLLWNSLLPQTRRASFFQSLDWLAAYWRHYGQSQRLRVLIVHAAGAPIGILPLVVRPESTRLGTVRVLTYPLHDWGTFYGPVGPNPTATLLGGLGHICRTARDWDLVDLRWVSQANGEDRRTEAVMNIKQLTPESGVWATSAQIDLAGTWENYWAARTSKWRNNVRRSEKRLAEQGGITYLRYRPQGIAYGDADPRWDLYDTCERLAAESWQGDSRTGTTLSHASIRPFLRDAHEAAARAGALDMNLLLVDGRPIAFNYAYQYRGYVYGLRTGFDSAPEHDGAGTVLQCRMIQDCFARGDHTYDLGAEYLDCKRYWQTHLADSYRYTYFPPRARAQALRLKRRLEHWWSTRRSRSA